ncbi:unnamed protein product [Heligmosomoides polygyrus]|uniref:Secreted protein n=1 Tax=Heligmosomoides polygyrus TaxID=6339 RepID=A0A183G1B0_HELPZ|nr:unnamed protein product [Heligmosomoides polygyrus]
MPTACLPLHAHQFILRIPIFLLSFHHFQLFVFVNFKLSCLEVLEYAGQPYGRFDSFRRRFLAGGGMFAHFVARSAACVRRLHDVASHSPSVRTRFTHRVPSVEFRPPGIA